MKADDECPLAVLRYERKSVDDLDTQVVLTVLQSVADHPECLAAIVPGQVLDVFEEQHGRRGRGLVNDPSDLEEQVPALLILEAVLTAQAQLLADARDAEWLAREPGSENVVRRELRDGNTVDVP